MTSTPPTRPRRTQRERSETTIEVLLDAARGEFAAHGYIVTSLDTVVAAAGVTKGALYHHFDSKQALFTAVYAREQRHLCRISLQAFRRKRDPLDGFYAGSKAFMEASLDPAVQRITLIDAPIAIGLEAMREIEVAGSLAMMIEGLRQAIDAGRIARRPAEPLATLLFGALCEASMEAARSEEPEGQVRLYLRELRRILDAL